jgi:hypothetical protein
VPSGSHRNPRQCIVFRVVPAAFAQDLRRPHAAQAFTSVSCDQRWAHLQAPPELLDWVHATGFTKSAVEAVSTLHFTGPPRVGNAQANVAALQEVLHMSLDQVWRAVHATCIARCCLHPSMLELILLDALKKKVQMRHRMRCIGRCKCIRCRVGRRRCIRCRVALHRVVPSFIRAALEASGSVQSQPSSRL